MHESRMLDAVYMRQGVKIVNNKVLVTRPLVMPDPAAVI